ncbi:MAG: DUF5681 domain-containing protein [Rickettsiales bacterium]|nr:DUF5681 domain-containing protein [Rickettsiales bacterium]
MTDKKDYEVGYKKPPKSTRFKPGQSGNPSGRPKGHKNASTMLREALNEMVLINENGSKREICKLEAMFKQLVNGAVKGDHRSIQRLLPLIMDLEAQENSRQEKRSTFLSKEDRKQLLSNLRERVASVEGEDDAN